ncbi:hypothetical protein [Halocola ammonii]
MKHLTATILLGLGHLTFSTHAQTTELFYSFDLEADSTMSDSCLWSKRYLDSEGRKYKQEWLGYCGEEKHWKRWKYRSGKMVSQQFGNDTADVLFRPVYRKFGIYQWVAMDTVPQWPGRFVFDYEDGVLVKETRSTLSGDNFSPISRVDHFKNGNSFRRETLFNDQNAPVEVRDYYFDESGKLEEIHFRNVGEKSPYRIVRIYRQTS